MRSTDSCSWPAAEHKLAAALPESPVTFRAWHNAHSWEGTAVNPTRAACLAFVVVASTWAGPSSALAQTRANVLPPHEVATIVRSTGIEPTGRPALQGTVYVVHGFDASDEPVRVVVDARSGRVLSARPIVTTARQYPLPPISVRRPFGPRAVYGGLGREFAPFPAGPVVRPPGTVRSAPPHTAIRSTAHPPVQGEGARTPLPRPKPPTTTAAKPEPASQPSASTASAQARSSEPAATGSVAAQRPTPAKSPGPAFPPMQTME